MPQAKPPASFTERVYRTVMDVPPGRVTTYGDVAAVLGSPRAARQVGFALGRLSTERAEIVPWQRVINAQGRISHRGEVWRAERQRILLEAEGIVFDPSGRCDLTVLRWRYPDILDATTTIECPPNRRTPM